MKKSMTFGIFLMAAAGIAGAWFMHGRAGAAPANTEAATTPATTEAAASEPAAPEPGEVVLKPEQVEAAGLKTTEAAAATYKPEKKFLGELQEDPAGSFTLRSPGIGTIVAAEGKKWPGLGATVKDGEVVGTLEVRLAAGDRIAIDTQRVALTGQFAAAEADTQTAQAALTAAKADYERLKSLNAQDKNVSDRVVEEAAAKVATEEAHLAGAQKTAAALKEATGAIQQRMEGVSLAIVHGGQVAEMLAEPGESVESGQAILRVVRSGELLAALDVPAGENFPDEAKAAKLFAIGRENGIVEAERIAAVPTTDPKTHGEIVLFRVKDGKGLRAGMPITAMVPTGEAEVTGAAIPASAVVRYGGRAWVYTAEDDHTFHRVEISVDRRIADGYFVTEGVKSGDKLVTQGTEVLLAAEVNATLAPAGGE